MLRPRHPLFAKPEDASGDSPEEIPQGPAQDLPAQDQKSRSKKPLIILGIIIVILIIGGGIYSFSTRNQIATDDAYTEGNVVTNRSKGYRDTLPSLNVDDNSFVKAGDLMIQIDPRDYINARDSAAANLALEQAQLLSARENYEIAKIAYPAKLTQAEAQKAQAEANQFQAQQEYKRQHSVDLRATTMENIDTSTAQERSASSQVNFNQANVEIAKAVPQNLKIAEAQVKQLEAQVAQAQSQLNQAELNLSRTEIRAPQDGWVTRRNVQLGTYLEAGQSMFQLVTKDIWVVANFKETQLDRMRIGQKVDISVDAYSGMKLTGTVQSIQMGSGSRFSAFPAENATGNYVKIVQRVPVKITLDPSDNLPIPIGLSVEPIVHFGSEPEPKK